MLKCVPGNLRIVTEVYKVKCAASDSLACIQNGSAYPVGYSGTAGQEVDGIMRGRQLTLGVRFKKSGRGLDEKRCL
jgi:hypothetical protein